MRRIALLTLIAFGCATTRPPEPATTELLRTSRVALAEPELELWMEGTGAIDPAESARALNQSRDALAQALAGRGLDANDPDELLVLRARAVARTDERKSAQVMSYVGIVFVVVALVAVAIVTSRSNGPPPPSKAVRPAGSGPIRPGLRPPMYMPYRHVPPPPIGFGFGMSVAVPIGPPPVPWATPTQQWLASRGWFDGDAVELTAQLVDPATGEVRWQQIVKDGTDPRDAAAVTRLVDRVLAGLPFGERRPAAPPLDEAPAPPPAATGGAPSGPPGNPAPEGDSGPGRSAEKP